MNSMSFWYISNFSILLFFQVSVCMGHCSIVKREKNLYKKSLFILFWGTKCAEFIVANALGALKKGLARETTEFTSPFAIVSLHKVWISFFVHVPTQTCVY